LLSDLIVETSTEGTPMCLPPKGVRLHVDIVTSCLGDDVINYFLMAHRVIGPFILDDDVKIIVRL